MTTSHQGCRRILIADDHGPLRATVRRILAEDRSIEIIGEVSSGLDAVRAAISLAPDVALLDGSLPGLSGSEAATQITEALPGTKCILLSLSHERAYIVQALRSGAWGYLSKEDAPDHLLNGIHSVLSGDCYLSPVASCELDGAALSGQDWAQLQTNWDHHAASLFHFVHATGASTQAILDGLKESLGVYAVIAAHGGPPRESFAPWMIVALTSILFDTQREARPVDIDQSRDALWTSHPSRWELVEYWQGSLWSRKRRRIEKHVGECRACHLDWCMSALPQNQGKEPSEGFEAVTRLVKERLAASTPAESFADVIRHETRMRDLASAQKAVLLGHCTGRSPGRPVRKRNGSMTLVGEFLGHRAVTRANALFGVL